MHSGCSAARSARFLRVPVPKASTSLQSPPVLRFHVGQTMFGCVYQRTTSSWFHCEKVYYFTGQEALRCCWLLGGSVPTLFSLCFFSLVRSRGPNPCSGHRVMHRHVGQRVSTLSPGFPAWVKGLFFRMGSSGFRSRPASDHGVSVDAIHQLLNSGVFSRSWAPQSPAEPQELPRLNPCA